MTRFPGIHKLEFNFVTEDGSQRLTLEKYHSKVELLDKIGLITTPTDGRRTVFLGTNIVSYPLSLLEKDEKKRKMMDELDDMVSKNALKYFVPQTESVRLFLNDREHNLKGMVAPNGTGKSVCGCIDVLLDVVECDPSWPIFAVHGVDYRRYRGPRTLGGVAVVSYEWNNHITTLWPQVIRRWTPQESLGQWAEGKSGTINWKNNPRIEIDGTPLWFFACSQAQTVFEASAMDIFWWDEQGEEAKFDGANMRLRRRNGRHVFTLTPHRVEGRPDTGAGSWIHKLYKGESTAGLKPKFYTMSLSEIPDWIYSEQAKKEATKEWIDEPTQNGNIKKLREGRSRIYGEFHESSGLVFDDWNRETHLVQPFDIPSDWTKYRGIDHGRIEPTAAIWAAVNPEGDIFFYREYYEKDLVASENAKRIIEASGNKRRLIDRIVDSAGKTLEVYEEIPVSERFRRTVLDSRSYGKKTDESRFTIGDIYRNSGLRAHPADGNPVTLQIVAAKEYLYPDPDRIHYERKINGAPKIYVFSNLRWFVWEIEQYVNERMENKKSGLVTEKPRARNDHLMSAMMFLCMEKLIYVPGSGDLIDVDERDEKIQSITRDPITGY